MLLTAAGDLIQSGDLAAARAAALDAVKRAPADPAARLQLAEALILLGEWERVDTHLDLASTQDPSYGTTVALIRQLVRASAQREAVFTAGATPELVTEPTPAVEAALRILVAGREGGDASALREAADEAAPDLSGVCDGQPFDALRDLDDRTAEVLEVLTPTGKYVWAPWSQVTSLQLKPVERTRDRIWRPAELDLKDGPSGVVYLPMIYPARPEAMTDPLRLGRETAWVEEGGLTCGLGQRCLLVGEEMVVFSSLGELTLRAED